MMIDADIIENVLSKKEKLEKSLEERQVDLIKRSQILEEHVWTDYSLSQEKIRENEKKFIIESASRKKVEKDLSIEICEEFYRQQKIIQEEILYIQKQQAVIHRIIICFEALPFTLKEILEKLCVQQQKWDAIELSKSTISYRKRKAISQILEWFHSDLTDVEIIQKGQWLESGK